MTIIMLPPEWTATPSAVLDEHGNQVETIWKATRAGCPRTFVFHDARELVAGVALFERLAAERARRAVEV